MRCAIVDIGSNTVKMSVFSEEGALLGKEIRPLGLIGHIQGGNLTREGIESLIDTLLTFQTLAARLGCDRIYPFATASLRAAGNREDITSEIEKRVGCRVEILTGEEEAAVTLAGIRFAAGGELSSGILSDMGGGSCEILSFEGDSIAEKPVSFPAGALLLAKNFVKNILPTEEEATALMAHVTALAKEAGLTARPERAEGLLAVGGTIRAIASYHSEVFGKKYKPERPYVMEKEELEELLARITAMETETKLTLLRLFPTRIHTAPAGLAAHIALLTLLGQHRLTVVEGGAREGYFQRLCEKQEEGESI